jgi:hypothetical protein
VFAVCRKAGISRNIALEIFDISAEGIRMRLSERVRTWQGVTVAIPTPRGLIVDCAGKVVWWERADDGTYIAGICLDQRLSGPVLARLCRDGVIPAPDPTA